MNRRPGMTLDGIGLFFQRDQTWWEEGKSFVDYITRCQTLLQYGHPVVDIAVFTGEEMPRRSILPERLVRCFPVSMEPNGWKANGFGWLMKVNPPVCVLSVLPIRQTWPIPKTG